MSEYPPVMAIMSPMFMAEIDAIESSGRLRPADPDRVGALAASINEIGLQQPIIVRRRDDGSNGLVLVAGAHRLAVGRLLGWTEIPAIWLDIGEAEARLVEIDENLIRNELNELDRALSLAERKRIYEVLHPETAHGKAKKPKKSDPVGKVANLATFATYAKDAARKTGLSDRTIRRAVELAGALAPEAITALRGSKIADNQAQLLALAALPADQQVTVAGLIGAGAANNVTKAREIGGYIPAGGAVRAEEALLKRLEASLLRLGERELRSLHAMIAVRLIAFSEGKPAAKKSKSSRAGAAA